MTRLAFPLLPFLEMSLNTALCGRIIFSRDVDVVMLPRVGMRDAMEAPSELNRLTIQSLLSFSHSRSMTSIEVISLFLL